MVSVFLPKLLIHRCKAVSIRGMSHGQVSGGVGPVLLCGGFWITRVKIFLVLEEAWQLFMYSVHV